MSELEAKPGRCQEAHDFLSRERYVPCNAPATRMIKHRDQLNPYRMCDAHASHNVKNRGGEDVGPYVHSADAAPAEVDYSAYAADARAVEAINTEDVLGQITAAVRELTEARAEVTEAEEVLKARQARVRQIEEFTIPELMKSVGQEVLKLSTGEVVQLSETLHAAIPQANLPQAIKWLQEHGQGALVKRAISLQFGKNEEERANQALALILEAGYTPNDKMSVHPMSLAAALRELLAAGEQVPMELMGAHIRSVAKVKPPKN